jgi:predicted dehydrogenase
MRAKEFGVARTCPVEELIQSEEIDLALNLTPPRVHAEIAVEALQADKHVYSEKPLATKSRRRAEHSSDC